MRPRISISRSAVLWAIVVAALLIALPFAVAELFARGELYLLSHRFLEDMAARLHGPGRLRFVLQPTIALLFGTRDGVEDARARRLPFLWGLVFGPSERPALMRSALSSIRDLVAVAILLDIAAQLLIFRTVHPGAALLLGPVLIAFPYACARALANRLIRSRRKGALTTQALRGVV